jgi:protein phosphatase
LVFAARSDIGRVRPHNEDAILTAPEHAIFGVCDGLGGAEGGEEASRIVVRTVEEYLARPPLPSAMRSHAYRVLLVVQALREAGHRIRAYAARHGFAGMASTATFLLFGAPAERRVTLLHVGDTLAFRLHGDRLDRLFDPHCVEVEYGPMARHWPPHVRQLLTRAIGIDRHEQMEPTSVEAVAGDLFLVASDGLTNMVPLPKVAELLATARSDGPGAAAQRLVEEANTAGGRDNISVVVVAVGR